jgi:hypothetical protein
VAGTVRLGSIPASDLDGGPVELQLSLVSTLGADPKQPIKQPSTAGEADVYQLRTQSTPTMQ